MGKDGLEIMQINLLINENSYTLKRNRSHLELLKDWEYLEMQGLATPYQTYAFVSSWLDTFGKVKPIEPLLISIYDDRGAICAILPMMIARKGPWRIAHFIGGKHANHQMGLFHLEFMPLFTEANAQKVLMEINRQFTYIDCFHFDHQPPEWEGHHNAFAHFHALEMPSPCVYIKCQGDEGAMVFESLNKKETKRKRDKKLQSLAEAGELQISGISYFEEIPSFLENMKRHREERVKVAGVPNVFEEVGFYEFCSTFMQRSLNQTYGVLGHYLKVADDVLATEMTIITQKRWSSMLCSMTSNPLSKFSPGEHLFIYVIEKSVAENIAIYDFGAGMSHYKSRFSANAHPLIESYIPMNFKGKVYMMIFRHFSKFKTALKNNEAFMQGIKKIRQLIGK